MTSPSPAVRALDLAAHVVSALAVAAFVLLLVADPADAACPPGLAAPSHEALRLPASCPAPFAGWLVIDEAYLEMARQLAAVDVLVPGLEAELKAARAERDGARADTADRLEDVATRLDALASRLAVARDVPAASRTPAAVWASAGAVPVLVCATLSYVAIDGDPATRAGLSGLAGGLCGAAGVGLAWLAE